MPYKLLLALAVELVHHGDDDLAVSLDEIVRKLLAVGLGLVLALVDAHDLERPQLGLVLGRDRKDRGSGCEGDLGLREAEQRRKP